MKQEFLTKATENIAVAELSYKNGYYNASANRAYYATFQAAIAALVTVGITANVRKSHSITQANFAAELIKKRKIYPNHLKSYLMDLMAIREDADYELTFVSKKVASRQLKKAQEFVRTVTS